MALGNDNNATSAITAVTGTLGKAVGGVTATVGGVVGAAGRGLGDTVNKTTNTVQGGNALKSVTGGLEDGLNSVAKGTERVSVGKKP